MTNMPDPELIQLAHYLQGLESERVNPASERLDTLSPLEIARLMNREDRKVADAVAAALPEIARAIEAASRALGSDGRVIYVGAGTSGRLGVLDAAEIPPTFSFPPDRVIGLIAGGEAAMFRAQEGCEDSPAAGATDLAALDPGKEDFVIGLAASGRTPYVLGALERARAAGATTAGISCNADSPLALQSDIPITLEVGPEILTGSTRLKSGTAQKQVLNMISTGAMVQIGKCYGNRMVDLDATNEKLKARAINLVSDLAPTDAEAALKALRATGWNIKAAILALKSGIAPDEAIRRIDAADGHLRRALEALQLEG